MSSVSADLSNTNEDLSKTKENLNTVASDLSTKSKELSNEITGVKQDVTGLTSTVNNNAGNISQLQQRATNIETTVADNNKKLSSQITQNANSISTVVANLNNTNLANSPYRSITQLKQTTDSISSVVSANKIAQDNVNSSLTSKINQTANSISSTVSAVVDNLNSTDLANSPYRSITQLKQTTDSISSIVSTNKDSTDKAISQVSQKSDTIKATIEGNLNSTDTSKSPYKAITQLQANINGVSSVVSANKSSTDSEISQLKQTANSISSTVSANKSAQDSVNSSLSSKIQQNAGSISSVVANLNSTNLANSPYRSITQLKQTTDSISSTVSANKSAQDSVNSSLTSKIQQNANSVTSIIANLSDVDKAKKNYSAISQLQDDINLRVAKGDVISQINLDKTGATIDGKLLHVTGDTVIEKNVIAKGMIQAGAVTADNMAAETINLTDKLKIQGGNVTLDENGLSVLQSNGTWTKFNQNGMTFVDTKGNTFAGIGRFCTGVVNDGQTVKFNSPWDITPTVFLFPVRLQTSAVGYTNINMYQDVEAINVSNRGFTAVCKSVLKAGSNANVPIAWECKGVETPGLDVDYHTETYSYHIKIPNTVTHIWISGEAAASLYHQHYNHESSLSDWTITDETSITISTNTGIKQEHPRYVTGGEGTMIDWITSGGGIYRASKAFVFDMSLSNVSLVTVTFSIYGPCLKYSGGKLTSYRTNLNTDVTVCRGTAGFIAIDPNTVPYSVS